MPPASAPGASESVTNSASSECSCLRGSHVRSAAVNLLAPLLIKNMPAAPIRPVLLTRSGVRCRSASWSVCLSMRQFVRAKRVQAQSRSARTFALSGVNVSCTVSGGQLYYSPQECRQRHLLPLAWGGAARGRHRNGIAQRVCRPHGGRRPSQTVDSRDVLASGSSISRSRWAIEPGAQPACALVRLTPYSLPVANLRAQRTVQLASCCTILSMILSLHHRRQRRLAAAAMHWQQPWLQRCRAYHSY